MNFLRADRVYYSATIFDMSDVLVIVWRPRNSAVHPLIQRPVAFDALMINDADDNN